MKTINKYCPRSGKPVSPDSLTIYRNFLVGFCNTGCRDDFREHMNERPDDRRYFDAIIKESEVQENHRSDISIARTNLVDFIMIEKDR